VGDVPLYYYGASSATQSAPANLSEIAEGNEAEITAALSGPTNKYLLFVNNDKDLEGEVEIKRV
jgi:hypothetical protein